MATFLGSKLARGVSSKIKETFDQTTQNVRERMAQTASHQEEERTLTPEQVVEEAFQRSSKVSSCRILSEELASDEDSD